MARTLVIRNANYVANMLAKVTFTDVECTGITFDEDTVTVNKMENKTINYTLEPAGASGTVTWESSNTDVVTVSDGVMTIVGIGEATVTATCNGHSATCTVTVDIYLSSDCIWTFGGMVVNGSDAGNFLTPQADTTGRAVKSFIASDSSDAIKIRNDPNTGIFMAPYKIPKNAKRFKLSSTDTTVGYCATFFDSTQTSTTYGTSYVKYINIKVNYVSADELICDFSDITTADSIIISVVKNSGNAAQGDEEGITIEFLPATA